MSEPRGDTTSSAAATPQRTSRPGSAGEFGDAAPGPAGDAVAVGLMRANAYRFLQAALAGPADRRFQTLFDHPFRRVVLEGARWMRGDPLFRPERLGPGELDPARLDPTSLLPRSGDDSLRRDYLALFGHSISKDCPPYGGEYYPNRDITFRSQRLADVAGFYRAFGLDRAVDVKERHDHLAFEAAFMETVIVRELYAVREGLGRDAINVCRRAQRDFFVDHLGWWLPAFGLRLSEMRPGGFYAALGRWIRALAAVERAVLRVPCFDELPTPRIDSYDAKDDGCGLCVGGWTDGTGTPERAP